MTDAPIGQVPSSAAQPEPESLSDEIQELLKEYRRHDNEGTALAWASTLTPLAMAWLHDFLIRKGRSLVDARNVLESVGDLLSSIGGGGSSLGNPGAGGQDQTQSEKAASDRLGATRDDEDEHSTDS